MLAVIHFAAVAIGYTILWFAVVVGFLFLFFLLIEVFEGPEWHDCPYSDDDPHFGPDDSRPDYPTTGQSAQQTAVFAVTLRGDGGLFIVKNVAEDPFVDGPLLTFVGPDAEILAQFPIEQVYSSFRKQEAA